MLMMCSIHHHATLHDSQRVLIHVCQIHLSEHLLDSFMLKQERGEVIQHIEKRPEAMWKINSMWSFRNEAKMYGSPMFDAVWAKVTLGCSNKMPEVVQALKEASLPSQYHKG